MVEELLAEVGEWEGTRTQSMFGWRGLMFGRRAFGCYCVVEGVLRVWTKLPAGLHAEAMATATAHPHPYAFRNWLELRPTTEPELEQTLVWLHHAYDWVRRGEPADDQEAGR